MTIDSTNTVTAVVLLGRIRGVIEGLQIRLNTIHNDGYGACKCEDGMEYTDELFNLLQESKTAQEPCQESAT